MQTIAPRSPSSRPSSAIIPAAALATHWKVPIRLTLRVLRNSSTGKWPIAPVSLSRRIVLPIVPMPAQQTSTRSCPCASRALANPASTEDSSETSTLQAIPPISPATRSARSSLRSNSATRAPFAASARALASPSPEAPPVTTAATEASIFIWLSFVQSCA